MRDFEIKGNKTWSWLPNDATITPFDMDKVIDGKTVKIPGHIPKGQKDILPDYGNPAENVGEELLFHGRIPPTA